MSESELIGLDTFKIFIGSCWFYPQTMANVTRYSEIEVWEFIIKNRQLFDQDLYYQVDHLGNKKYTTIFKLKKKE